AAPAAPAAPAPAPHAADDYFAREARRWNEAAADLSIGSIELLLGFSQLVKVGGAEGGGEGGGEAGGEEESKPWELLFKGIGHFTMAIYLIGYIEPVGGARPEGAPAADPVKKTEPRADLPVGEELRKKIDKLVELALQVVAFFKQLEVVHPHELKGVWKLTGDAESKFDWEITFEAPTKAADGGEVYKGKLETVGLAGPQGTRTLVREARCELTLSLPPEAHAEPGGEPAGSPKKGTLRWKKAEGAPARPKLACDHPELERALAEEGEKSCEVEVQTNAIDAGSTTFLLEPGQEAAGHAIHISRKTPLIEYMKLLLEGAKMLWRAALVYDEKKAKDLAKRASRRLQAFFRQKLGGRFMSILEPYVDEADPAIMGFTLKPEYLKGTLGWSLADFFAEGAFDAAKRPADMPNPLVPRIVSVTAKVPKIGVSVLVGWKHVTKQQMEKTKAELAAKKPSDGIPVITELVSRLLGVTDVYIAEPVVKLAEDPKDVASLTIPIIWYLDEIEGSGGKETVNSKFTFGLVFTADAIANLCPEIRMCLMAWQAGCFIGECLRNYTPLGGWADDGAEGIANLWSGHEIRIQERLMALKRIADRALQQKLLTTHEHSLFVGKLEAYVRINEFQQEFVDAHPATVRKWRLENIELAVKCLRERRNPAPDETDEALVDFYKNWNLDSEEQGTLYKYLWGADDSPTRDQARDAIDAAAVNQDGPMTSKITPARALLWRAYLSGDAQWTIDELKRRLPDWQRAYGADPADAPAPGDDADVLLAKGARAGRKQVFRHDYSAVLNLMYADNDQANASFFKTYCSVMAFPWRDATHRRYFTLQKVDGQWCFKVYWSSANPFLNIKIYQWNWGTDDVLTHGVDNVGRSDDHYSRFAERYCVTLSPEETQAVIANMQSCNKEQGSERLFWIYAAVTETEAPGAGPWYSKDEKYRDVENALNVYVTK
ncbi:MAG TPA: hypothetical protein VHF22_06590, partial [Planctomycetota bacterium]|nr:hypothetical protein [Planctomycetota bacterium]